MTSRHVLPSAFLTRVMERARTGPQHLNRWASMRFMLEFPCEYRFCKTAITEPHILVHGQPVYLDD